MDTELSRTPRLLRLTAMMPMVHPSVQMRLRPGYDDFAVNCEAVI